MTTSTTKTETKTESKPKVDKTIPKNPTNYKKSVELGKKLSKDPEKSKMEVATQMYDLIKDESREVISMAFSPSDPVNTGRMISFPSIMSFAVSSISPPQGRPPL